MNNDMDKQKSLFTDQEKTSVVRYGAVLLDVHNRLVIEGYFLEGGKIWNIFKVGELICEAEMMEYY